MKGKKNKIFLEGESPTLKYSCSTKTLKVMDHENYFMYEISLQGVSNIY